MSIRLIARELYRLQQEVEQLETRLAGASWDQVADLKEALRKARIERNRLKRALDGAKDPGWRRPSS